MLLKIQSRINREGYSSFRLLLDTLTERIKTTADEEIHDLQTLIDKGRRLFPEPVRFSPSWERIWDELVQAVYLYACFRPQLERNEYIRLQKIQTLVMDFGS